MAKGYTGLSNEGSVKLYEAAQIGSAAQAAGSGAWDSRTESSASDRPLVSRG